jgi:peptide subunit release factor 1 (eRF1)
MRTSPKVIELSWMECEECHARFHFTNGTRATRVPRCRVCGSLAARAVQPRDFSDITFYAARVSPIPVA